MYFVTPLLLLVAVHGRDISDAVYYPYERYNKPNFNSPPPGLNARFAGVQPLPNIYEERSFNLNNNRQPVNNDHHRDFSNDRNGRRHNYPHGGQRNNGVIKNIDINLSFEGQGSKSNRESNFNIPKQSCNVNNAYAKRDAVADRNNNRSFKQNLPGSRTESDMVFRNDENVDDRRNTADTNKNTNSNSNVQNNDASNTDIISFLGITNVNTTNDSNHKNPVKNKHGDSNNYYNQNGVKSKTTIENEVTPNPFHRKPVEKDNAVEDKWVWGDGEKTVAVDTTDPTTTLVTLDDRAAFDGDKCATGTARVGGKCVPTD